MQHTCTHTHLRTYIHTDRRAYINTCTCILSLCNCLAVDIRECAADPCENGACIEGDNSFTCSCQAGYGGEFCEIGKSPVFIILLIPIETSYMYICHLSIDVDVTFLWQTSVTLKSDGYTTSTLSIAIGTLAV